MIFIYFRKPTIKKARVHARAQRLALRTLRSLPEEQRIAEVKRIIRRVRGNEIAKAALSGSGIRGAEKKRAVIKAVEAFAGRIGRLIPRINEPGVAEQLYTLDVRFKQKIIGILGAEDAGIFLRNYFDTEVVE